MSDLIQFLKSIGKEKTLIKAVLSAPIKGSLLKRISVRPILVKNVQVLQMSFEEATKITHKNLPFDEALNQLKDFLETTFSEGHFFLSDKEHHWIKGKGGKWKHVQKATEREEANLSHNRKKRTWIDPKAPFWAKLDVCTPEGKVKPSMQSKYTQVQKFLEIVEGLLERNPPDEIFTCVDFGCGKGYLTFALAQYLKERGQRYQISGIDLKKDVINKLNAIASELSLDGLQFYCGTIEGFDLKDDVDLVISLHACDTATDDLLAKAMRAKAQAILSAPCCQHELAKQIEQPLLQPLLKHGILRERFAALVTDAARAALLEKQGYQTDLLEFVDTEHTPKNLLIRAIRKGNTTHLPQYKQFADFLHIHPKLQSFVDL